MKNVKIRIERFQFEDKQTLGNGTILKDGSETPLFEFKTVELAWNNNIRRKSCIPPGIYKAVKHQSPKFGLSLWLQDVPNRSEILMHPANFWHDLLGCIAPGKKHAQIDGDGYKDVTSSRNTMKKILSIVPDQVEIEIVHNA